MSSTTAAGGFVVFLLCARVIQSQNDWGVTYTPTEICAPKGMTVEMSCTYRHPSTGDDHDSTVQEAFLFTKLNKNVPVDLRRDSQYSGRVEQSCGNNVCTLRIRDVRESDSAKYHFNFRTRSFEWRSSLPGTTLTVTALQVQVIRITTHDSYTEAELKCLSSCSPAGRLSYVWFKNKQEITEEKTSSYKGRFDPSDTISCALEGHENYGSPPVYGPKLPSVSVSPSGEIVEGSSVNLTCSSDANPAATYTWYKRNANLKLPSEDQQLVLISIQSSDSGEYYCTAENKLGKTTSTRIHIDVKYPPKLPSVSVSPSGEIVEGSSVTLTCSSDANPAATYTWYKENQQVFRGQSGIYRLTSIRSEHRGNYSCKSENQHGQKTSSSVLLDVQYPPKLRSVSVIPSGEIVEDRLVTLTCRSDANPAATYTWYKRNANFKPLSKDQQFVFRSIQSSDSGEYYCAAENKLGRTTSTNTFIDVKYPPNLLSVSVSPSGEIVEGSSVTLTCSSDANPAATYTWYKENRQVFRGQSGIYHLTSIRSEHRGNYFCKSENRHGHKTSSYVLLDVQYPPKLRSVSVSPSGEIVEDRSVTLTCSSDANPAATYTWYKRNANFKPLSKDQQFVFRSIQSSDSGEYYCTAENKLGRTTSTNTFIDVKYPPQLPSVSVSPSGEIVEGSSVTLTCSSDAKPAATYTWYKENANLKLLSEDQQLVFSSIQSSDSGEYYCLAKNRLGFKWSQYISIDVKYPPKLPSVSVRPSGKIMEGSSVTLTCSSDAKPAATYTWYKENQQVFQGQSGIYHLTSIRSEHRGNYSCKAENQHGQKTSSSVLLDVQYPPKLPSVSVSPSGEIVEGSSVNLICSSDANPAATYTWYKRDEDSPKASGQIFTITDFRAEDSGNYYCEVWNKWGSHNSTSLHLSVKAGSWKSIVAGSIIAVLLVITCLSVSSFLLIRKKKSSKQTAGQPDSGTQLNMGLMRENPSAAVQRRQAEEQDDLCYASVSVSKNQEDPLYCNISPARLNRHRKKKGEEEEDAVEYSAVHVKRAGASPQTRRPEDLKDLSALYSTVNKTART